MPIVHTEIGLDSLQADGKKHVHEYHVDHTGKWHPRHMHDVPADADSLAIALARVPEVERGLRDGERDRIESEVGEGADPATLPRDHLTARQAIKPIVRAFMQMDPDKAIRAAKFIRGKLANAALDAEVGPAIRQRIRQRVAGILAIEAELEADAARREKIR